MNAPARVVAVLVTYQPDLPALETHIGAILPQVDGLVLVDNGSANAPALRELVDRFGAVGLFQSTNLGIGQAQNAGIARALDDLAADAVLMMDQDSGPAPDMVDRLRAALAADPGIAVASACYRDGQGAGGSNLIASGSLFAADALRVVGPFDETLFMDFVDTDWGHRAEAVGRACVLVRAARMRHALGQGRVRVPGRSLTLHAPERTYYQLRNLLLLARHPATPRGWLWRRGPRFVLRSFALGLTVAPRRYRLGLILRGLWDGLRGRRGPL